MQGYFQVPLSQPTFIDRLPCAPWWIVNCIPDSWRSRKGKLNEHRALLKLKSCIFFLGTDLMTPELEIFDNPAIYVEEPPRPPAPAARSSNVGVNGNARTIRGGSPLPPATNDSRAGGGGGRRDSSANNNSSGVSTPKSNSSRAPSGGRDKTTTVRITLSCDFGTFLTAIIFFVYGQWSVHRIDYRCEDETGDSGAVR